VSWVDKDDSQDWQAFFHARNRLVAALLHSETKGITRANLATDWRHLLSYQYYAVAARLQAYDYVLNRDPKDLFADMKTRQGNARELAKRHTDGQVIRDPDQLAALGGGKANAALRGARRNPPPGVGRFLVAAQFALRHLTTAPRSASRRVPEAKLAYDEARWWIVPQFDSVLVTNAEGSGATFQHRDRKQFLRMALSSFRSAWLLRRRWRALSVTYRAALPYLTSSSSWSEAIGIDSSDTADTEQANAPST
jgi:galactofuranosylgalactofuranosylrhamnosyl-N-acetylglucosaminyl-diphospho-decaprenol beta-1,5/1,6-galactofuranosyltransferase